jgi:hypothetical protein
MKLRGHVEVGVSRAFLVESARAWSTRELLQWATLGGTRS